MSLLFDTLPADMIEVILKEKKIIDETKKNKEKFNETIKSLNTDTIVYWYEDGGGEMRPYFIWEMDCCYGDASCSGPFPASECDSNGRRLAFHSDTDSDSDSGDDYC
tara:strand:+ start:336 stop:656 length:321 start_codon:yes stop_codon:yes gene_type:complete